MVKIEVRGNSREMMYTNTGGASSLTCIVCPAPEVLVGLRARLPPGPTCFLRTLGSLVLLHTLVLPDSWDYFLCVCLTRTCCSVPVLDFPASCLAIPFFQSFRQKSQSPPWHSPLLSSQISLNTPCGALFSIPSKTSKTIRPTLPQDHPLTTSVTSSPPV